MSKFSRIFSYILFFIAGGLFFYFSYDTFYIWTVISMIGFVVFTEIAIKQEDKWMKFNKTLIDENEKLRGQKI